MRDGKQVLSHIISRFDFDAYCQQAPHHDFTVAIVVREVEHETFPGHAALVSRRWSASEPPRGAESQRETPQRQIG